VFCSSGKKGGNEGAKSTHSTAHVREPKQELIMAAKNVEYEPLSVEKSRQKPLYILYDCEAANSQVTADIVEIAARCFSEITTTAFESLISTSQELGKFSKDIVSLFIMLIMLCFFVYYAYYVVFLCLLCLLLCLLL
jgi:hypothetical protein